MDGGVVPPTGLEKTMKFLGLVCTKGNRRQGLRSWLLYRFLDAPPLGRTGLLIGYDLPGFKLDDVARMKLNETKVPVQSTGLWSWYTHPQVTAHLLQQSSAEECYEFLNPRLSPGANLVKDIVFFKKDSFLVYRLFEKEMVLSFLVERANFTAWDAVQALHMGNSSFLLELFKTYGTCLGYFVNTIFKSPVELKMLLYWSPKTKRIKGL
ncbi:DNA_pol_B_exo1 domain-containing protein [Trichonephila inaurata madagascariensis]|uniref:DNA_pol_B_exo1 domain-containing protein n=1 Tax=Trichonephila inaurata madagascariensis TaxID=2747483 RepID=A0A8X6Y2J0_9ARAC|nr:DNA_pol_B_exo1 domain-containing protein [Trichonephila inaurata madagascariensis]